MEGILWGRGGILRYYLWHWFSGCILSTWIRGGIRIGGIGTDGLGTAIQGASVIQVCEELWRRQFAAIG